MKMLSTLLLLIIVAIAGFGLAQLGRLVFGDSGVCGLGDL